MAERADPTRYAARKIASLRRARGWSQGALAEALGVNQSTAHRWETGAVIDIDTLVRIARALKCSPRDLVPRR